MLNQYLAEEQIHRSIQAQDEYNQAVDTIEFQAREDAAMGAEPHPDKLWDDKYWIPFCEALRARYSRMYKKYPKSVSFNPEHLF